MTRVVVGATVELVGRGTVVVEEFPGVHAPVRAMARTRATLPGRTR